MTKESICIAIRSFFSMISMALIYFCMYVVMLRSNYFMLMLALIGVFILFFVGVSCGWLNTIDGMIASISVKMLNYILFALFSYHIYKMMISGYNIDMNIMYRLLQYGVVLKLIVIMVASVTCIYSISVIINRDMNIFLKIFLSITQYIAVLDLIVLIILSSIFYITDKRRVEIHAK